MPDTEVRVGVAGTGGWTNSGHMAVYQQHPQATLVGVCDVDIQLSAVVITSSPEPIPNALSAM